MKTSVRKALIENIEAFQIEEGNVRGLAYQLTSALLHAEAGRNPYKLAWKIAMHVGDTYGGKFKIADVVKSLDEFQKDLKETPEYTEEYFRQKGMEGSNSLTHEERVINGKKGAESYTHVE